MRLVWAFLVRDFRAAASYRLASFLVVFGGLITLTTMYFLAQTMGESLLLRSRYRADYFSFVLVGIAGATLLRTLQSSFAGRVRDAQTSGMLEVLLSSPRPTTQVVALLACYPVANALFRALGLLLVGALVFGARLDVDPLAFGVTLVVAAAVFAALGLLSAAFVLAFKRGDPFGFALDTATYLLSGVLYPTDVLPPALRQVSELLPATHALRALRAAALRGATLSQVADSVLVLAAFGLLLWPLAALSLSLARRHVERTGSLPHA